MKGLKATPKEKERVRLSFCEVNEGLLREDEDSVRRSTKKKKGSHQYPLDDTMPDMPDMASPMGGITDEGGAADLPEGLRSGVSYKESLLGELPGAYEQAFFGSTVDMEPEEVVSSDDEEEPPEEGEVIINFPSDLKRKIRAPWSTSLIVKVFGRSVGYLFLVNKLKSLWQVPGGFSCVDLGLGFFLVRFTAREDFEAVLKGGPWFIGEYFLSLRPWVPNFRASEAAVSSVAVWIRLPELPVEYYQKDSLMLIGRGLGPVLRVDFNTASGTRGRFARLCIQLDLNNPLKKTIRVGKTKVAIIYEGIGLLCFHCGKIGHRQDLCPTNGTLDPDGTPVAPIPEPLPKDDDQTGFGPWMMVTRRKRQNKSNRDQGTLDEVRAVAAVPPGQKIDTRSRSGPTYRYKQNLDKGKKASVAGPSNLTSIGQMNCVSTGPIGPSLSEVTPHSLTKHSTGQNSSQSHIQIKPNLSPQPSPKHITPTHLTESTLSLRPQTPCTTSRHDKHKVGFHTNALGFDKLGNTSERESDPHHGGHHRYDQERPTPCLGLVQCQDTSSLGRHRSSSPRQRLSRSPSPNRFGLVTGDQPLLELPIGFTENRRSSLSTEDSLSAVAGAAICAISGGGVQCNSSRVRREEGSFSGTNSTRVERKFGSDQVSPTGQVHSSIRDGDMLLRDTGGRSPSLQILHESSPECLMGDVAREGFAVDGSGRQSFPNQ